MEAKWTSCLWEEIFSPLRFRPSKLLLILFAFPPSPSKLLILFSYAFSVEDFSKIVGTNVLAVCCPTVVGDSCSLGGADWGSENLHIYRPCRSVLV